MCFSGGGDDTQPLVTTVTPVPDKPTTKPNNDKPDGFLTKDGLKKTTKDPAAKFSVSPANFRMNNLTISDAMQSASKRPLQVS